MQRRAWGLIAFAVVALLVPVHAAFWNHSLSFPPVYSDHGVGVQRMLNFTIMATGLFLLAGHVALALLVLWFALRPPREVRPVPDRTARRWAWLPGLLFAVAAEGGVLLLGLPVWGKYYGPPPQDALRIEVTGRQFFWVIRYPGADGRFGETYADRILRGAITADDPGPCRVTPDNPIGICADDPAARDDIFTLNEMAVPVNRPVMVILRSMDVIHSFFLPQFRVKQDAVPGMRIRIWFVPKQTGQFEIVCNHICGLGHYRMRGFIYVMSASEFQDWMAEQPTFME